MTSRATPDASKSSSRGQAAGGGAPDFCAFAYGALLLTAEQAASALSICRTKVYELIRTDQLESVQIGSSWRIPVDAIDDYVERLRTSSDYTRTRALTTDNSRP